MIFGIYLSYHDKTRNFIDIYDEGYIYKWMLLSFKNKNQSCPIVIFAFK